MKLPLPASAQRAERIRAVTAAAGSQHGVLSRRQLYELGCERWHIEAEVRAGRWRMLGRQTVRVCDGDPLQQSWWHAVLEVAPSAVLDGVSALMAAGLVRTTSDAVHVAVPKSSDPRRCRGVVVHETRRYDPACVLRDGIPRMQPATAAVHAALWARTDKQAAYFVLAAGQQRLFTPEQLAVETEKVRRAPRRRLLRELAEAFVGGVETLGEREFAKLCTDRGFPTPQRQVRHETKTGRVYLDVVWPQFRVTVEIDGIHHLDPSSWLNDALKQNTMTLEGHAVLRIPNLALRLDPEPFLDQIEAALRSGGWPGPAARRPAARRSA